MISGDVNMTKDQAIETICKAIIASYHPVKISIPELIQKTKAFYDSFQPPKPKTEDVSSWTPNGNPQVEDLWIGWNR